MPPAPVSLRAPASPANGEAKEKMDESRWRLLRRKRTSVSSPSPWNAEKAAEACNVRASLLRRWSSEIRAIRRQLLEGRL